MDKLFSYILNKVVNKYLEPIDSKQLNAGFSGFWKGEAELLNMTVKQDLF